MPFYTCYSKYFGLLVVENNLISLKQRGYGGVC